MNRIVHHRPTLKELFSIRSDAGFHTFLVDQAVKAYKDICKRRRKKLGSVLALGSNQVEAENLPRYPFELVALSNIGALDERTQKAINKKDSRIAIVEEDLEAISTPSQSYDYVFCKESLHHVPRPVLGVYEMLRTCKNGISFIEPRETLIGSILGKLGIATQYEGGDPKKQPKERSKYSTCYVYRWNKKELEKILTSYYLETGYELHINSFWLSNRKIFGIHIAQSKIFKLIGWALSFLPFSRGNFIIVTIAPGKSLPAKIR